MALPGVGKLTAMTLVAEIGDIGRFPTARKLCAFTGLTPQVRNSDRKVHRRPHHQAGLAVGVGGPARRPPRRPSATPCSPGPSPLTRPDPMGARMMYRW